MTIPPSSRCSRILSVARAPARDARDEVGHRGRRDRGPGGGAPRRGARARARIFAPPPAHGGGRARRRHDPHGAPRWLRRRVWPGLVPLREALGARALPATRPGGSAAPHGRSIPPHLRGVARALASIARGLSAPRPDARALVSRVAALLLARQAPHGARPAAAPRRGG